MKTFYRRLRWFVALTLLVGGAVLALRLWPGGLHTETPIAAQAASANAAPDEDVKAPSPPARLRVHAGRHAGEMKALLDPASSAWKEAKSISVLLSRTPRIYQTSAPVDRSPPALEVRALRADGKLVLWLRWDDETKDAPEAPPRKSGEGGAPERLYKRPTGATASFADAAAVMVPEDHKVSRFPSLMMGEKDGPVRLFYWNASHGAEQLIGTGRATPKPTGESLPHRAGHADGKWTLTLELPDRPNGCPLAFAVWDGRLGDRDGTKWFSIWYTLTTD